RPRLLRRSAAATARALRQFDGGLELVACGSSHRQMPTFGSWEATVLEQAYDELDLISAHAYYEDRGTPPASCLLGQHAHVHHRRRRHR
ncbi:MAG TPA: hypothetical protein VE462_15940, partial [Propionibacteriaceae bacterium]|nr:hypothetical protein [Propionibacteriaceae bacterium]